MFYKLWEILILVSQYLSVHSENPQERLIAKAVDSLRRGGVMIYPTDSVYAIGCHIGDKSALERIRSIRQLDKNHNFTLVCRDLSELGSYAKNSGVNVIVENHGRITSNIPLLMQVINGVNMDNCGTLPDFGNFCISDEGYGSIFDGSCKEAYDIYKGISEMMPRAFGVSAKSYDFDYSGNETKIDYSKMIDIVKKAGYKGYVGIEYEGSRLSEDEGIVATKKLLEKLI